MAFHNSCMRLHGNIFMCIDIYNGRNFFLRFLFDVYTRMNRTYMENPQHNERIFLSLICNNRYTRLHLHSVLFLHSSATRLRGKFHLRAVKMRTELSLHAPRNCTQSKRSRKSFIRALRLIGFTFD